MKTILLIIVIIIALILLVAFMVPFVGFATMIGYIIKNSLQKKTPEFLANEKIEMESKVLDLKKKLQPDRIFSIYELTNDIEYSYSKAMSNKLSGHIFSIDGSPMIAFQRIDRGIYTNSRIIASATDFKIYFEYKNNENLVFYNEQYLGKIINNTTIVDATHQPLGSFNRNHLDNENRFSIVLNGKPVALLFKNSDRKNFIENPSFRRVNDPVAFRRRRKIYRETPPTSKIVIPLNETNETEQKWIIALSVFEIIYYGFEFIS